MKMDKWFPHVEYGATVWRRNRMGVSLSAYWSQLSRSYEWMAVGRETLKVGKSRTLKGALNAAVRAARVIAREEGRLEA